MQKTGFLISAILILLMFTTTTSAKVKMIGVVHLADGSIVTGEIIETIPNETIKIKTIDGHLITYPFEQIEKIKETKKSVYIGVGGAKWNEIEHVVKKQQSKEKKQIFSPIVLLLTLISIENNLRIVELPVTFKKRIGHSKSQADNKIKAIKYGLRFIWLILSR